MDEPRPAPRRTIEVPNPTDPLVVTWVDSVSDKVVAEAIAQCGYAHRRCHSLDEARALIDGRSGPTVLILHGLQEGKALALPANVHAFTVAGPRVTEGDVPSWTEALRRPLKRSVLQSRLHAVVTRLERVTSQSFDLVFTEVMQAKRSGEVVVRSEHALAKLYVEAGRLAWVHRSDARMTLSLLLKSCGVELEPDVLAELMRECRDSQKYFGDVLVDWQLVEREPFIAGLRRHLAQELEVVSNWKGCTATFAPNDRPPSHTFTFGLEQLRWRAAPSRLILSEPPASGPLPTRRYAPEEVEAWLVRIRDAIPVACALVDPDRGVVLGNAGMSEESLEGGWSLVGALVSLGQSRREVMATSADLAFLARSAHPRFDAVLIVCWTPAEISLAMARRMIDGLLEG